MCLHFLVSKLTTSVCTIIFSLAQLLSHIWLFVTPWTAICQASLYITNSRSLLKLMSIKSMMPSNHLLLCRPLLLQPSIFPNVKVLSNESVLRIRWANYCSFSFSISPSNEHPGLISFRMDWLDLLAVQGTLSSLRQHHRSAVIIPVSLPPLALPHSRSSPEAGLPELHSSFPPAIRLTPDPVCMLMLLSPFISPV